MTKLNEPIKNIDSSLHPLISVIVPTKNSEHFLGACLSSIREQSYARIEIIVVDNYSTDATLTIANELADKVETFGPERSAQVNRGVEVALGEYVYKVDSDFILEPNVIRECVDKALYGYDAVVVHNSPDIRVSWLAKVRKFEVDMYKYDLTHSSARFVRRSVYQQIGGFNPNITAGEDYDFQNKLNHSDIKTGFVDSEALHLGEPKKFWPHMKKYFAYGKDFNNFTESNPEDSKSQLSFIRPVYLRNYKKFIRHPIIGVMFIGYNLSKYFFGGIGYLVGRLSSREFQKA